MRKPTGIHVTFCIPKNDEVLTVRSRMRNAVDKLCIGDEFFGGPNISALRVDFDGRTPRRCLKETVQKVKDVKRAIPTAIVSLGWFY